MPRVAALLAAALTLTQLSGCIPVSPQTAVKIVQLATEAKGLSRAEAIAPECDAYVAQTYPDFEVLQREPLATVGQSDEPGNWYVLRYKDEPALTLGLLVLKPKKVDDDVAALQLIRDVDFFTTDGLFRQLPEPDYSPPTDNMEKIISLYLDEKPSRDALVTAASGTIGYAQLYVDSRPDRHDDEYSICLDATHVVEIKSSWSGYPGELTEKWTLKLDRIRR